MGGALQAKEERVIGGAGPPNRAFYFMPAIGGVGCAALAPGAAVLEASEDLSSAMAPVQACLPPESPLHPFFSLVGSASALTAGGPLLLAHATPATMPATAAATNAILCPESMLTFSTDLKTWSKIDWAGSHTRRTNADARFGSKARPEQHVK